MQKILDGYTPGRPPLRLWAICLHDIFGRARVFVARPIQRDQPHGDQCTAAGNAATLLDSANGLRCDDKSPRGGRFITTLEYKINIPACRSLGAMSRLIASGTHGSRRPILYRCGAMGKYSRVRWQSFTTGSTTCIVMKIAT